MWKQSMKAILPDYLLRRPDPTLSAFLAFGHSPNTTGLPKVKVEEEHSQGRLLNAAAFRGRLQPADLQARRVMTPLMLKSCTSKYDHYCLDDKGVVRPDKEGTLCGYGFRRTCRLASFLGDLVLLMSWAERSRTHESPFPEDAVLEDMAMLWGHWCGSSCPPPYMTPCAIPAPEHWKAWEVRNRQAATRELWFVEAPLCDLPAIFLKRNGSPLPSSTPGKVLIGWSEAYGPAYTAFCARYRKMAIDLHVAMMYATSPSAAPHRQEQEARGTPIVKPPPAFAGLVPAGAFPRPIATPARVGSRCMWDQLPPSTTNTLADIEDFLPPCMANKGRADGNNWTDDVRVEFGFFGAAVGLPVERLTAFYAEKGKKYNPSHIIGNYKHVRWGCGGKMKSTAKGICGCPFIGVQKNGNFEAILGERAASLPEPAKSIVLRGRAKSTDPFVSPQERCSCLLGLDKPVSSPAEWTEKKIESMIFQ